MGVKQKKVLFLCTGNSCRSQMAEAWAKTIRANDWIAYSAGLEQHGMNPNVIQVMGESGVDMKSHYSKTLDDLKDESFDIVVTVCDSASSKCPTLLNQPKTIHAPFEDPPKLAKSSATDEAALDCYRQVRDQIRDFIRAAPF